MPPAVPANSAGLEVGVWFAAGMGWALGASEDQRVLGALLLVLRCRTSETGDLARCTTCKLPHCGDCTAMFLDRAEETEGEVGVEVVEVPSPSRINCE